MAYGHVASVDGRIERRCQDTDDDEGADVSDARRLCEHAGLLFNLDDALKALGWPADYQFLNIGTLPSTDVRTGYPTPTLLWKGKDLFGMSVPERPYDVPS